MHIIIRLSLGILIIILMFLGSVKSKEDLPEYFITLKKHHFIPDEILVPANTKFRLIIKNEDPSAEEFESDDLKREKIIAGNSETMITIAPLKAGKYHFKGEFHDKTAQGSIIIK